MDEDESESSYLRGNRAAYVQILGECLRVLGYGTPEGRMAALVSERESAIASLRGICANHGDNDWEESLHLYDILEKHLARHLGD